MSDQESLDMHAEPSYVADSDPPPRSIEATTLRTRSKIDFVRDRYDAGDRFLDIGCGDGAFLDSVASNCPGLSCTGIDIAPGPLSDRQRSDAEYLRADALQLPFSEQSVRFIHFDGALRHLVGRDRGTSKRKVIAALSAARDALRDDGWVLVTERSPRGRHLPDRLVARCLFTGSKYGSYPRSFFNSQGNREQPSRSVYTRPELEGMLAMAGFQVSDVDVHRDSDLESPRRVLQRVTQRLTFYASPR